MLKRLRRKRVHNMSEPLDQRPWRLISILRPIIKLYLHLFPPANKGALAHLKERKQKINKNNGRKTEEEITNKVVNDKNNNGKPRKSTTQKLIT